jgi:hypothetical protein
MVSAVAGLAALSGVARAQGTACSNATLAGDYAFSIQGEQLGIVTGTAANQTLHLFGIPVLVNGVAMASFDGTGKFTQVDFVVQNGIKRPGDTISTGFDDSETGTYTVNPDCTGTFTVNAGGSAITVMFVVAGQGNEIHTVVSALHAPAAPPTADGTACGLGGCDLGVNIRSDGVKVAGSQGGAQ